MTELIDEPDPAVMAALSVRYPHEGFEVFIAEKLASRQDLREEVRAMFYEGYPWPTDRPPPLEDRRLLRAICADYRTTLFPPG